MTTIRDHEQTALALFAWQGFSCRLPSQWNPIAITGDHKKGKVRLGDLVRTRMEFVWQASSRRVSADRVWNRYRRKIGVDTEDRDSVEVESRLTDHGWLQPKARYLDGEEGTSLHVLVRGPHSGRFLLVRLPLDAGQKTCAMAEQIVTGLEESNPVQPQSWSLYGFSFAVIAGSNLARRAMHPGHLSFTFECRRLRMTWQRFSFGARVLAGQKIEQWLATLLDPKEKKLTWLPGPSAPRGGSSIVQPVRALQRLLPAAQRTRSQITAWHDKQSDQLLTLSLRGPIDPLEQAFEHLADSWKTQIMTPAKAVAV